MLSRTWREPVNLDLESFRQHMGDFGLGTIAEIFDAEPPHDPKGCIAQAWSVAEVLRCSLLE